MTNPLPSAQPTKSNRFATAARAISALSMLTPPIMIAALFVVWKYFQQPFWTAADRCFTVGLTAYIVLATIASFLNTIAGLRPFALFAQQLTRLASLGVYLGLRYVFELGFLKSVIAWAAVYFVAGRIVRRIERRAPRL
jgi:hypothetical protein